MAAPIVSIKASLVEPTLLVLLLGTTTLFAELGLSLRSLPYDTFLLVFLWAWSAVRVFGLGKSARVPQSDHCERKRAEPAFLGASGD
jgi:hypothetical protein